MVHVTMHRMLRRDNLAESVRSPAMETVDLLIHMGSVNVQQLLPIHIPYLDA